MELLSHTQEQLVREQFPSLVDLRMQIHFTYWSELHLVTQELCDQLPFGQIFSATSFYRLIDFQLGSLVTAAQRTLTLWALIGVRQYNGSLVDQLALFHDETFLWHYSVPPKRQEILYQIRSGNRVRFLSRFFLLQAKIELEFSEIRLLSIGEQLVYTDSKEYTYDWVTSTWETHVHNLEFSLIDPRVYTLPILIPNTSGQETEYQDQLERLQALPSTLILETDYWGSVTTTSSLPSLTSRASTPESEYHRSRALASLPLPDVCLCGTDVCYCEAPVPNTPPTPSYIFLWKPSQHSHPIKGLHYDRYTG